MGTSQRIRTELGINKTIKVELEQDFNYLEILSLKIQQEDVYVKSCSQYGVLVGRVTANNGFGLPNARVSVFIPIEDADKSNPRITSIYPYTAPEIRNEDGYRYNLLPYEKSYSNHSPTGTFPSAIDVLTDETAIEIYDKYYKFVVKTNQSGDYMIMGVPLGIHTVFLDLDLSDIGEFSLTPQDLIRMGRATDAQVSGSKFKSSSDLNSLPQIVSITKSADVSPLWGDPEICQIAINRVDFDLRDDANIDIQPTAVFMGSLVSSIDSKTLKPKCKPATEAGNNCNLVAGPGQILSIRQTIFQDSYGRPILEQYNFDGGDDVIDESGSWVVDLPMNLDYIAINEFGERIISNDPKIGIPTNAKYRFKVKWKQSEDLGELVKRGYYLVPNIREYGWTGSDPSTLPTGTTQYQQFIQSYAFSLNWEEYGYTGSPVGKAMIQSAIDCEDRFFFFNYNKVYTVSSFIDGYHKGTNRGRYIGIKQITDPGCDSTNYKFPTNDGSRNFDILFNIINIVLSILITILLPLLIVFHVVAFLWPIIRVQLVLILFPLQYVVYGLCRIIKLIKRRTNCTKPQSFASLWRNLKPPFQDIPMPIIPYPSCEMCECTPEEVDVDTNSATYSFEQNALQNQSISCLIDTQGGGGYGNVADNQMCSDDPFLTPTSGTSCAWITNNEDTQNCATSYSPASQEILAGNASDAYYKRTPAPVFGECGQSSIWGHSFDLTMSERLNLFNLKGKYFNGLPGNGNGDAWNQIKVSVRPDLSANSGKYHHDNVIAILLDDSCVDNVKPGSIVSFNGNAFSSDLNVTNGSPITYLNLNGDETISNSITGLPRQTSSIVVNYADPDNPNNLLTTQYAVNQDSGITDVPIPFTNGNILTFTYNAVGNSLTGSTYTNIPGETDNIGTGATFNITVAGGVVTTVTLNKPGYDYSVNDTITISGLQFGGTSDDSLEIKVQSVTVQQYFKSVLQKFKTDIEYFQVITAMTYSQFGSLNPQIPPSDVATPRKYNDPNVTEYYSFRYRFTDNFMSIWWKNVYSWSYDFGGVCGTRSGTATRYDTKNTFRPIYTMSEQKAFIVAFLVRGVDPHSARQQTNYDISRLLGNPYGTNIISGQYKLNIPIQPGLVLARHDEIYNNQVADNNGKKIFYQSYLYQPTNAFSGFTTNLTANYSSLDAKLIGSYMVDLSNSNSILDSSKLTTTNGYVVASSFNNQFVKSTYAGFERNISPNDSVVFAGAYTNGGQYGINNPNYLDLTYGTSDRYHRAYYPNEYVEGGSYFYADIDRETSEIGTGFCGYVYRRYDVVNPDKFCYFAPAYSTGLTMSVVAGTQDVVMRSDRLPTSTYRGSIQGENVFALHQNNGFSVFAYDDEGVLAQGYPTPSEGVNSGDNILDEPSQFETTILDTFSCTGLVPLDCYQGYGTNFGLKNLATCQDTGNTFKVTNGCYRFVRKGSVPLVTLPRDIKQLVEWKLRFKVNLAACRGVFGHSFYNNWINGTLYAPPFKNNRFYSSPLGSRPNQPYNKFCTDVLMLHPKTYNFYYRSSPYSTKFIGANAPVNGRNSKELLFPTTIMDLGPRDEFANELILAEDYFGYNMNKMKQTTYQDISNILNLFIISRQISSSFWQQLLSVGGGSVGAFFSRRKDRFDGDYAQMISINSEVGVDEFDFESYNYDTGNTASNTYYVGNRLIGIFFSSDTQTRDYLTPRRIIRNDTTVPGVYDNLPIFTQEVPMYKWLIRTPNDSSSIFGEDLNEWLTTSTNIQAQMYQKLDRTKITSNYYQGQTNMPQFQKGFIYNIESSANGYNPQGNLGGTIINGQKITVGAPFHFYFGLVRGNNALDKFNRKYLGVETF